MVQSEIRRLTEGVTVHTGVRLGRDVSVPDLFRRGARGVVLAAWRAEEPRRAVVIGGGNVAMDTARALLRGGVSQVTVCYRGGSLQVKALPEEREEAWQEGIALQLHAIPLAVRQENGRVAGVRFRRSALERRPEGGLAPAPLTEEYDFTVPADMLVFAVGYALEGADLAESGVAASGGQIALSDWYATDAAGV